MKRITIVVACLLLITAAVDAQQHETQSKTPPQKPSRDATREKLRALLDTAGPKMNVSFRQSEKQPYNFVGILSQGLKNSDSLEIVILVSEQDTIHFRIYPRYKGSYVNIDRVAGSAGLMRQMLRFSDTNFLYWGADSSGDIFAGYNFTLESGFPEAAIGVVLNSIANLDQYVGQMKPALDGS